MERNNTFSASFIAINNTWNVDVCSLSRKPPRVLKVPGILTYLVETLLPSLSNPQSSSGLTNHDSQGKRITDKRL
jgi:hypothetical protein